MLQQKRCVSGSNTRGFVRPFTGSIRAPALKAAVVVAPVKDAVRKPAFPFVRIQGQELMKLAICLNVIDPAIGGVLIMGDRGTGKSVTVRCGTQSVLSRFRSVFERTL